MRHLLILRLAQRGKSLSSISLLVLYGMSLGSLSYKSVSLVSKKALITVEILVLPSKLLQTVPFFNINGVHVNGNNFFIVLKDARLISGFGMNFVKNLIIIIMMMMIMKMMILILIFIFIILILIIIMVIIHLNYLDSLKHANRPYSFRLSINSKW